MKDFYTLKILDRFRILFVKLGVDYFIMRKILQIKLIMDNRREMVMSNKGNNLRDSNSNFRLTLIINFLFGSMFAIFAMDDGIFMLNIFFGFTMFILITTLISDFSVVLLDTKEKNILLSKPIDNKTMNIAKILHILIYMFLITVSITGPMIILKLITKGIFYVTVMSFELIMLNFIIIILTAFIYIFLLRFFNGERLKDIINIVQISMTIFMFMTMQVIGIIFELQDLVKGINYSLLKIFVIPLWFTSLLELIFSQNYSIETIIFSGLVFFVPIVSIVIYIKLIPTFERHLQKLDDNSSDTNRKGFKFENLFSKICFDKNERTYFKFIYKLISKERNFKLRVYPSVVIGIFLPLINILDITKFSLNIKMFLFTYFVSLGLINAVEMLKYSQSYKGAWIYYAMPISDYRLINKSALKAVYIKFFLPSLIIIGIVYIFFFGVSIIKDLLVVCFASLIIEFIYYKLSFKKHTLPFSIDIKAVRQSNNWLILVFMMILGLFLLIHGLILGKTVITYIYIFILIVIDIVLYKGYPKSKL